MTLQNIGFGLEALGLFRGHEYRAAARHVYATAVAQKRGGGYERLVAMDRMEKALRGRF